MRSGMEKFQPNPHYLLRHFLFLLILMLMVSRAPHVCGFGHKILELEKSKATEDNLSEGGKLTGSSSGPEVVEDDQSSYDEFEDHGEYTDADLDPGSWRQVLESGVEQNSGDPNQAAYFDGVKKMADAFGKGEPGELQDAIRVLQSAADNGHAHAQSTLAFLYGSGTGLQQSEPKSLLYHHFAAEGGNCQSKMALAYYYYRQQVSHLAFRRA